jgi:hypothetical protein
MRAGPPRNPGELPPRTDLWRAVPAPRGVGEQVPHHGLPHLIGHVEADGFSQVIAHPAAGLDMGFGDGLEPLAGQPQPVTKRLRIGCALAVSGPIRPTTMLCIALQSSPQAKRRLPLPLQTAQNRWVADIELEADHRDRSVVFEVRTLGFAPPPRQHHTTTHRGGGISGRDCHVVMKPSPTDTNYGSPTRRLFEFQPQR